MSLRRQPCGGNTVTVEILGLKPATAVRDTEGYTVPIYVVVETVKKVTRSPLSGEIADKRYGVSDNAVRDLLVNNMPTDNFKENVKVRLNGDDEMIYEVVRVKDYGGHQEMPIKPFQGGGVTIE